MNLDQLTAFSFSHGSIRGAVVRSNQSFQDLTQQQGNQPEYPLFIKQLLGEMSAILLLMASNLKICGSMNLQIRGSGFLYSAFTEVQLQAGESLQIRGLARRQDSAMPASLDLRDWVGPNASLAITLSPKQGRPYQGIVPLEHSQFTQCIEEYYQRSEQIPTYFWTQLQEHSCAALMVQHLPGAMPVEPAAHDNSPTMDMNTAQLLVNTLKPGELIETETSILLYRLFHEYEVRVHDQMPIHYKCSCSRSRMEATLLSLSQVELEDIASANPIITMDCQFCGAHHDFNAATLLIQDIP